ncbi:MAG TPA: hypothetical protein PKW08_12070 [Flavobacteriaceae bacterium]|nr:hypothetical protein [Flavobacteriaceae bacterium]MCB9213679.1 hypothetical protein [Alteromonas sp.]HPF12181.1 hypothetical protein [Flavobacteriaceae bacterium]HQU22314.1 hypothetical protein [Flavobacteriaceae bacterium]HQU66187.1 hypothetical protein [Flavobacteriaceae bacterium]
MKTHNLGTFSLLFMVKGILTLLLSLFFIAYACFGFFFVGLVAAEEQDLPFNFGYVFIIIGGILTLFTLTFGVLTLLAAKYLKEVRNYNFILVVAILNCLTGVLGILLGVFTMVELMKPEVKALFYPKPELQAPEA